MRNIQSWMGTVIKDGDMSVSRNNLFYNRDSYHGQVEHALINIHSHTSSSLRVRGPASTISCHPQLSRNTKAKCLFIKI